MKRKFFAVFLSLCMAMSLVPTTVLAAENETGTQTPTENSITSADALKQAIEDAQPGGTVTLDGNIDITAPVVINKQITLDLDGKEISASSYIWNENDKDWSLISVREKGDLTIKGNGTLKALENDSYAVDVMDGGSCTIESGTFVGNVHAVYVREGTLEVNGGTFSVQQTYSAAQPYEFVLNCYDENYKNGSAQITVYGGSFEGFNPRDCEAEGVGTNFCAPGYVVEKNQGTDPDTYTVKKLDEGSMAVFPAQSTDGSVSASLEGTFASNTDKIQGGGTAGGPSGDVDGGNVSVNLTTKDGNPSTAASLNVATDTARSLADNANSLTVKSDVGTVSLDKDALDELATVTEPVVISIKATDTDQSNPTWEVTVTSGEGENNEIFDEGIDTEAITISVPYTDKSATTENTKVYCIDDGMEDMGATFADNRLTWTTSHLSTFAAVTLGANDTITYTTANGVDSTSDLSTALSSVKDGGTITLLKDATLKADITISKNITIDGQGKYKIDAKPAKDHAITVAPGGALTLKDVTLNITDEENQIGTYGLDVQYGATLTLNNAEIDVSGVSNATISASWGSNSKEPGKFILNNSKITATNIGGNFSNGGDWALTNSSIEIEDCASNGFSCNSATLDNSTVSVSGAKLMGVTAKEITLKNDSAVTVEECGTDLPKESKWATDDESYKHPVEIKKGGKVTIDSTSSMTLQNNVKGNNTVYFVESTLDNNGTLQANVLTKAPAGSFSVTVKNGNSVLDVATVMSGGTYKLPAALSDYGYNHFVGWSDGTTTYDANTPVKIEKDTTFTAVWSYTPPANPNYKITIGDMENGSVTANPTAAKAGATVTLTATPDEGYALSTLTVTDRFGDAVRVTENSDGTYTFTMPNGQVTVTATFVETEAPVDEPFVDVAEGDWFYDAVVYAYQNELMDGVGGNRFAPNSETTRAQLVTILYRLEGQPAVSGDLPFTDVETGTWYTDAILWAAQNNIVNGVSDTEFAPGDDLTRQQLVTILYRYAEAKGYDVSASADLSGYPDAGQVQDYAQPAMAWAVAENIIQGMEDGTLKPAGNASRAQIATILIRFCEDVAQ